MFVDFSFLFIKIDVKISHRNIFAPSDLTQRTDWRVTVFECHTIKAFPSNTFYSNGRSHSRPRDVKASVSLNRLKQGVSTSEEKEEEKKTLFTNAFFLCSKASIHAQTNMNDRPQAYTPGPLGACSQTQNAGDAKNIRPNPIITNHATRLRKARGK